MAAMRLRLGKETLSRGLAVAVAQDLERDDLLGGLVERVPNVRDVIAALEHRQAVATREELADLPAADGRRGRGFGAVHLVPTNADSAFSHRGAVAQGVRRGRTASVL